MKTTVVIPNYNGIKYLANCIESLKKTDNFGSYRILIVDNGSTDGSLQVAYDYQAAGVVEVLALPENTGFCGAVNAGIRRCMQSGDAATDTCAADSRDDATSAHLSDAHVTGAATADAYGASEYILLLNNDTEVYPDFVSALEAAMEAHSDAFSISSQMLALANSDILDDCGDQYTALGWAYGRGKGKPASKAAYQTPAEIFAACGGAAIYRASVFAEIGLFDEQHFAYLEDIDIGYRARLAGLANYYEPTAKVLHAGSGASGSRYNEFKINLSARNNLYLIYKNMPTWQIVLNILPLFAGFFIKYLFFVKKGYGKTYRQAISAGFALCKSEAGKAMRQDFKAIPPSRIWKIQGQLLANMVKRLFSI